MKQRRFGHIIALLLASILLLTAVGCGGAGQGEQTAVSTDAPTTTAQAETTAPAPTTVSLLDENGQARYRIVRPDVGSQTEINAGIELNKRMKALTGATHSLISDFLMPKDTIESVETVYEILIGQTNRPESAAAAEGLSPNAYVIQVTDYKIVLIGGSMTATYGAMEAFAAMVEKGDGLVTKADGTYTLSIDASHKGEIEASEYLVALTNQGESVLEVYNVSSGRLDDSTRVWSYRTPYNNIAGAKLRHSEKFGDVALIVCGSNHGYMVSYPEGKQLWATSAAAANPHSIELMPNGVIAIASSNGNAVHFFTPEAGYSQTPDAIMTLTDAHGVLWDEQNQVLWAVGRAVLTAYKVNRAADGKVTVTEDTSRRVTIPTDHAHDLAPVYGDTNALWITTGTNVYRFDKMTKTFATDYAGNGSLNRANVKGVGNFADGSLVFIYPDGKLYSWTSQSMVFVRDQGGKMAAEKLISEKGHFYKARVWDAAYQ